MKPAAVTRPRAGESLLQARRRLEGERGADSALSGEQLEQLLRDCYKEHGTLVSHRQLADFAFRAGVVAGGREVAGVIASVRRRPSLKNLIPRTTGE